MIKTMVTAFVFVSLLAMGNDTEKAITVVPIDHDKLDIDITGLDRPFLVNQPIELEIRGTQAFHLYIFNINKKRGKITLLFPNQYDRDNMFYAGHTYSLPEKSEFRADRRGTEKLLFIASKRMLNLDTSNFKTVGQFLEGDYDVVEPQVKAITVLPKTENPVVRAVDLRIKNRISHRDTEQARCSDQSVRPFLSTDRTSYAIRERFRVTFGADRDGFIYLFSMEPDREPICVKANPVRHDQIYHFESTTAATVDRQGILAVFTRQAFKADDLVALIPPEYLSENRYNRKHLLLDELPERSFAYNEFEIN